MNDPKKVIVLGAAGQVGGRLTKLLLSRGFEVYAFGRTNPGEIKDINFHFDNIDLLSEPIENIFENIRAGSLFHCAWETTPEVYLESKQNEMWFEISKKLISEFELSGGNKSIIYGTCAEYSWETPGVLDEDCDLNPISKYAKSKVDLLNWLQARDSKFLWIRTFFQFGLNENVGKFIPDLIDSALSHKDFYVASPYEVKDFVYIKDVVQASFELFEIGGKGVFNMGTGIGYELQDIAKRIFIETETSAELAIDFNNISKRSVVANNSKLLEALPSFQWTNLDIALKETVDLRNQAFKSRERK